MYCPKCGTQNDDNNYKCTNCGTIIQQMPYSNANAPVMASSSIGVVVAIIAGIMFFIAIIGILAAIAIPQFYAYRQRSYNAAAQADLRNAATAQEGYFIDHQAFTNSLEDLVGTYGLYVSQGVTVQILEGNENGYNMRSLHEKGDNVYEITGPGGEINSYPKEKYLE